VTLVVSLLLIILSLSLLLIAKNNYNTAQKMKKQDRIPNGKIQYTDLNKPAQPLFSKRYRLTGKPDYIVKKGQQLIPFEVKNTNKKNPQKNHIMQLAAYCHLLEENYKQFVPYGVLSYNNEEYPIQFDPKLRFELENTITTIRSLQNKKNIPLNHNDPKKCVYCSMKKYCNTILS